MTAFSIPAADLYAALTNVLPHASTDQTLPVLRGVHVKVDGDTVTFAATDRYSLGLYEITLAPKETDEARNEGHFIVGLDEAKNLQKLAKAGGPIHVAADDRSLTVTATGQGMTVRLLDGEFPRYRSLIPEPLNGDATPFNAFSFGGHNMAKLVKIHDGRSFVKNGAWKFTAAGPVKIFLAEPAFDMPDGHRLRVLVMPVKLPAAA